MDDVIQRAFRVTGRVQGVGFRWWVRRHASDMGLAGFVRNTPDGAVEVEAAGPRDHLERLRALLVQGPPAARVTRVEEIPATGTELPNPFTILV